jgi:hypothetical protein
MLTKKERWLRLRNYHFANIVPASLWNQVTEAFGGADASTKAFASKMARKHGWSTHFALRAIDEYRKFVFLGVSGEEIVTPSKTIDTVWHEHLLFTRAYREFCRDVLERDFDHHPELIPTDDQTSLYAQQYDLTLARYQSEFRVRPPDDIWGSPKFKRDGAKETSSDAGSGSVIVESPLYEQFDGLGDSPGYRDMPEFSGGGGFSGAGGGHDWGNDHSTDSGGHGDSGDAGGGDGGSGCSSGCGGD